MVLSGSAQCTRASGTQAKERVGFVVIMQLNRSALLQAAAATLSGKDFARNMVQTDSALLKAATTVYMLVVSAKRMVANQSALGNGVPQPLLQGEGVTSTVVAARKSARSKAAPLLLKHAVSA